LTASKQGHCPS
jgi:hypothetical protein